MAPTSHLFAYQQLVKQSNRLLQLAKDGLWNELITCEADYVSAMQQTIQSTHSSQPDDMFVEQLLPMLSILLDNEATVKQLLQDRMDKLTTLVKQPLGGYGSAVSM